MQAIAVSPILMMVAITCVRNVLNQILTPQPPILEEMDISFAQSSGWEGAF